ncbi:hypothetical protein Lfu02_67930 [Longispora fulva]|uniref:DUF4034 domain-containing protein n=1 Tax=Longispora fulva TaxID=619741 RepID=A0A8J7GKR1_9ACTN|nr:DUF4034 domain-containing protein [Longispora fulva]MBG6138473.1 hypothetical protein [Longispora fulva]GIG62421.1 hypothetical protein Lfu02_67930 [Longispora fulva]
MIHPFGRKYTGPKSLPIDPTYGDSEGAKLQQAMLDGDWATTQMLLEAATEPEDLTFLVNVASQVAGCEDWLPEVARSASDPTLPLLVHGARAVVWAWEARTNTQAKYVGKERFAVFFERLARAEGCLQPVVRRAPDNVVAWYWLMKASRSRQRGVTETRRRFEEVASRCPGHLQAHQQMLQQLSRKWGGSHDEMHTFATTAMHKALAGSPLGMLVAEAHLERWLDFRTGLIDVRGRHQARAYIRSSNVLTALHEAADLSVRHPDYQRHPRTGPIVHGTFALAFSLAGDQAAAAEQFRLTDNVVTQFPWSYASGLNPARGFCRRQARAFARA